MTWNIEIATQTRWIPCGDITADTFEDARDIAIEKANPLRKRGEKFSGGIVSRFVSA